jgi:hypothetical protein
MARVLVAEMVMGEEEVVYIVYTCQLPTLTLETTIELL